MNAKNSNAVTLPLVIQLGFAGSRRLLDSKAHPGIDTAEFEREIETWLAARMKQLRQDLRLDSHHFFCGISALAIGGDTVFSRACQTNKIAQRIFLPQTRDEFLNARGSDGPDFPLPEQRHEAQQLLASPHVIQERLVSDAVCRDDRFDDTNREIVRVSDILICLVRCNSQARPGGTEELIARAVSRGKPVLVIQVDAAEGKPVLSEQWRLPQRNGLPLTDPALAIDPPRLPTILIGTHLPDAAVDSSFVYRALRDGNQGQSEPTSPTNALEI